MRELELAKETVRRFYRADSIEQLLAKPRAGRPSVLDAYKPYLHELWNAGITNASTLYREITEQATRAAEAPSPPSWHHSAPSAPHHRPHRQCPRSARSLPGYCATLRTSMPKNNSSSNRYWLPARTWRPPPPTSARSPSDQKTDVRPRQIRPPPQAHPPRRVTRQGQHRSRKWARSKIQLPLTSGRYRR
jgi:hypothetical protein